MRTLTVGDPAFLAPKQSSYADLILSKSPLLYVPMTTADPTPDSTANGRSLDWTNTAPTSGVLFAGGGVTLAGTTDSRFNNGTYAAWMGTIRTIEVWVQFTSTADIALWSGRPWTNLFACYHDNTNGIRMLFGESGGINVGSYGSGSFKINNGQLRHVMVSWTSTTFALFVDGVSITSGAMATYSPASNVSWGFGGGDGGGRRYVGQIGHGAAYASTLTLADAQAHNTRGRA